ncbi:homeobox protein vent1 [Salmo salar]|uniref:Homeobox protein vent1 n=1 Tax=Salmo salar TaxID=8030 RepID=A0A1S3RWQ4_SALSA|nr:homeobox protein vent1 [Salmo salar]|eukprot:XP_014056322.1 PREDICTED: homeobox protein vent1-like [Salmo salar]
MEANIFNNFTVDWLAKSHHDTIRKEEPMDTMLTHFKPHVPCMVQPRPPTSYNKVYLQPKPKTTRFEFTNSTEKPTNLESRWSSPLHPSSCSSPNLSENSEYSSGYDSEAASSECPSVEEESEEERDGAQRRVRTRFTPSQIEKMEKIFNKHKYPDAGNRVKTARKLNLSETQVRTWFQNRRMKQKREVQDFRAEYLAPAQSPMIFQPIRPFQYHGFGGQHLSYTAANHAMYMVQQMVSYHQHPHPMMSNAHFY